MRRVKRGQGRVGKRQERFLDMIDADDILRPEGGNAFQLRMGIEVGAEQNRMHLHATLEIAHRMKNMGNPTRAADEVRVAVGEPLGLRLYGQFLQHTCSARLRKLGLIGQKDHVNVDVVFVSSHGPLERYLSKDTNDVEAVREEDAEALIAAMQGLNVREQERFLTDI